MDNTAVEMAGKICLITGGSDGIGKVAALELAKQGARVVLICRNPQKGKAVVEEIKEKSQNPKVDLLIADLSLQREVRRVAKEFLEKYDALHVLLNNAGALFLKREVTEEGLELSFALNHMAYFTLTDLLLDTLKKSAPARIINVSSEAHRVGKIDFDDLQGERGYKGFRAYAASKLANIMFTYTLAEKLSGTGVTVNCLHPGTVGSAFGLNNGGVFGFLAKLARPLMLTSEKGAETSIYLASSHEVEGVSGKYFAKKAPRRSSKASYNKEVAQKLWEVSEKIAREVA